MGVAKTWDPVTATDTVPRSNVATLLNMMIYHAALIK